MDDQPFLWNFLDDVEKNIGNSQSIEKATESANEESNIHSIEFL